MVKGTTRISFTRNISKSIRTTRIHTRNGIRKGKKLNEQLANVSQWCMYEDVMNKAQAVLVNFHHKLQFLLGRWYNILVGWYENVTWCFINTCRRKPMNGLARAIFFGKQGELRERSIQHQLQSASALNIINAISI